MTTGLVSDGSLIRITRRVRPGPAIIGVTYREKRPYSQRSQRTKGENLDHTCPEHCPAQVAEAVADELRKLYPEACPDVDVDMFMEQLFRETLGLTRLKMPCSGPVMVYGSWKCPLDDISSSAVPRAFAPPGSHARDLFEKVQGAHAADPGQFL